MKEKEKLIDQEKENEEQIPEIIHADKPSYSSVLHSLITSIESLYTVMPIVINSIKVNSIEKEKDLHDFINKKNQSKKRGKGEKIYITTEELFQLKILAKQFKIFSMAIPTMSKSILISLLCQFDAFLGRLIKLTLSIKPELINASEKKFTYSELLIFDSMEDAKDFLLEKEVEGVLRESRQKQFRWMENRFGMKLTKDLEVWPLFVELSQRRNLFVHSDGIVSSQYIKVCENVGADIDGINIDDSLFADKEYIQKAYEIIFEVGLKLVHVLWRKFLPDQMNLADININEVGYSCLLDGKNDLAKVIFDFCTDTLKDHGPDEIYRMMIVNKAQAYKWIGLKEEASEIMKGSDWSATSLKFKLADAIISDNFEIAYRIMKEMGNQKNTVIQHEYRTWPLFKEIKKTSEFQDVFKEIFNEPFIKIDLHDIKESPDLEKQLREFQEKE